MLYSARWKKITVDQSNILKNQMFRVFWTPGIGLWNSLEVEMCEIFSSNIYMESHKMYIFIVKKKHAERFISLFVIFIQGSLFHSEMYSSADT